MWPVDDLDKSSAHFSQHLHFGPLAALITTNGQFPIDYSEVFSIMFSEFCQTVNVESRLKGPVYQLSLHYSNMY
jgi:hypothetical protein